MATIAIDFGTTNTVVTILDNNSGKPKTLNFAQISRLYHCQDNQGNGYQIPVIPSLVFINQNQELILGEKVRSLGLNISKPDRYFQNFKRDLLVIAEKLKISLSYQQIAQKIWLDENSFISSELELTRDKLTEILEHQQLLEQLRYALDEVLHLALKKGIKKRDLEQVLLVGGTCFIPAIQKLIIAYFGEKKVKFQQPFTAVCHGALASLEFSEIDDYLHHTYAIRLWNPSTESYFYFPLFEKG